VISGSSFGFGYDALSRRTSLTRPNTVNTSYSYDNLSRLAGGAEDESGNDFGWRTLGFWFFHGADLDSPLPERVGTFQSGFY